MRSPCGGTIGSSLGDAGDSLRVALGEVDELGVHRDPDRMGHARLQGDNCSARFLLLSDLTGAKAASALALWQALCGSDGVVELPGRGSLLERWIVGEKLVVAAHERTGILASSRTRKSGGDAKLRVSRELVVDLPEVITFLGRE